MNYLLITTSWKNPGDIFIKLGVEYLVKKVDPEATFTEFNKEDHTQFSKILSELNKFDKIIWCGMPMLWSFPTHHCHEIFWWVELLRPIMKARKKDLAIIGAGTAGPVSTNHKIAFTRASEIKWALDDLITNSSLLTLRDDCISLLLPSLPKQTVIPCPAIFAAELVKPKSEPIVCNLMPNGGHYTELHPQLCSTWKQSLTLYARTLLSMGAMFVPHTMTESELATNLGWIQARICPPIEILSYLKGANIYYGNRVHGAIVASSYGAKSLCIGYDLRLRAAEIAGSDILYLSTPGNKNPFPEPKKPTKIQSEAKYIELLTKFIKG